MTLLFIGALIFWYCIKKESITCIKEENESQSKKDYLMMGYLIGKDEND